MQDFVNFAGFDIPDWCIKVLWKELRTWDLLLYDREVSHILSSVLRGAVFFHSKEYIWTPYVLDNFFIGEPGLSLECKMTSEPDISIALDKLTILATDAHAFGLQPNPLFQGFKGPMGDIRRRDYCCCATRAWGALADLIVDRPDAIPLDVAWYLNTSIH